MRFFFNQALAAAATTAACVQVRKEKKRLFKVSLHSPYVRSRWIYTHSCSIVLLGLLLKSLHFQIRTEFFGRLETRDYSTHCHDRQVSSEHKTNNKNWMLRVLRRWLVRIFAWVATIYQLLFASVLCFRIQI